MRPPRTVVICLLFVVLILSIVPVYRPPLATAASSATLQSAPDGTLFLSYNQRRHRAEPRTLAALGIAEQSARPTPQPLLEQIPEGDPLPLVENGMLVVGPRGDYYVLLNGLHPIPDEETLWSYGWGGYADFAATPATPLPADLLALAARGPAITLTGRTPYTLFDWGNCTWWVAQRRAVSWLGNASEWYANAQAAGYEVGDQPLPGAILVRGGNYYGHVAYVESVHGASFTVSEMNVRRLGELTTRTYDIVSDRPAALIGFIYWKYDGQAPAFPYTPVPDEGAHTTAPLRER